ncbi:MAG: hemerythrin family protein [Armatimonadetes bacterium]|nr:hemerythrin family protein [Armatimonadota bacterium]
MTINKLNELVEAMQSGAGDAKVREIVAFTATYAAKHFALEESHMARVNCPVAIQNKQAHAQFLKRFGEIKAKVDAGGVTASVSIETMRELSTWITTHIKTIDTQLAKM